MVETRVATEVQSKPNYYSSTASTASLTIAFFARRTSAVLLRCLSITTRTHTMKRGRENDLADELGEDLRLETEAAFTQVAKVVYLVRQFWADEATV